MNTPIARTLANVALLCVCSGTLLAQPSEEANHDALYFFGGAPAIMPFAGDVTLVGGVGSVPGQAVTGQPYSAEAVTESIQALADGNRIVNTNRARLYRDSEGRTRREHTLGNLGIWRARDEPISMITIDDPVANSSYILDSAQQTARKIPSLRIESASTAVAGLAVHPPTVAFWREMPGIDDSGAETQTDVTVAAPPDVQGPVRFDAPVPPPLGGFAVGATGWSGIEDNAVTEDLGEQVLQGLLVRGTRHTRTLEAGAIGNEKPIEIVSEQWFSPELQVLVLQRHSDPRFGETIYRLINVDRSEPPPELFAVPQDYTVVDDLPPAILHRAIRSTPAAVSSGGEP